jgi:hypothetical protein
MAGMVIEIGYGSAASGTVEAESTCRGCDCDKNCIFGLRL